MSTEAIREFSGGSNQISGLGPKDNWPYPPEQWQRVSFKYAWIDLILNLLLCVLALCVWVAQLVGLIPDFPFGVDIALGALAFIWFISSLLAFRRTRTIGYMLREDDFVYRRGLLFHRVVAVPYGRLQLVDVKQGPLLRAFGLASLKFVTAAAGSNVELPGLTKETADKLRDQLISIAETRRSGL